MDELVIPKKKNIKGEDGYKIFSIRVGEETLTALDHFAEQTNRSRNEIINIMLEYGITHGSV